MAQSYTGLIELALVVATAISTWIARVRLRRRIKKALGRSVNNEMELTSLNTWMKVEEEEERKQGGKLS